MAERRRRMQSARSGASSSTTTGAQSQSSSPPPPDDDDDDDNIPPLSPNPNPNTTTGGPSRPRNRKRAYSAPHSEDDDLVGSHRRQQGQQGQQQQSQPLHNGTATQLGGGAVQWSAFGQTVYVRDATKHPPLASYIIALIIGVPCVGAIFQQMLTTYSAFSNMIFDGKVWEHFTRAAQDAARTPVIIMVALIAVSFQAPLIFFAFKIDKRFASERHLRLSFAAKLGKVVDITKEVIASNLLLSIWAFVAIIADTIGDVSFVATFTDSSIFLFFYSTGLYALSTIGLSESLQMLWDGMVTSEWLRHVKAANDYAALTIRNAASKRGQP